MKTFALVMFSVGSSGFIFCSLLALINAILAVSREANPKLMSWHSAGAGMFFSLAMVSLFYLTGVIT